MDLGLKVAFDDKKGGDHLHSRVDHIHSRAPCSVQDPPRIDQTCYQMLDRFWEDICDGLWMDVGPMLRASLNRNGDKSRKRPFQ